MNISFDIDGTKLKTAMDRAPVVVTQQLNLWIYKTTYLTERAVKQNIPPRVDTGRLINSVHSRIGFLRGDVQPNVKYALPVHEGRRPGSMPPFAEGTSLASWANRRGIPPFLVARSIARRGTKGHPFMDLAYKDVKPQAENSARKLLNDIVRAI